MGRAVALAVALVILGSVIGLRDRVIGSMLYYPEPGVALTPERLGIQADEVFLTNSLIGVWPVIGLENRTWHPGAVTRQLQERLANLKTEGTAWQHY